MLLKIVPGSALLLGQPFSTQLCSSLQKTEYKVARSSAQGQTVARKCSHYDKAEEGAVSPGQLQVLGGFGQRSPRVGSLPVGASPSSNYSWPLMVPPSVQSLLLKGHGNFYQIGLENTKPSLHPEFRAELD